MFQGVLMLTRINPLDDHTTMQQLHFVRDGMD
jgi:hypothetical protein